MQLCITIKPQLISNNKFQIMKLNYSQPKAFVNPHKPFENLILATLQIYNTKQLKLYITYCVKLSQQCKKQSSLPLFNIIQFLSYPKIVLKIFRKFWQQHVNLQSKDLNRKYQKRWIKAIYNQHKIFFSNALIPKYIIS